MIVLRCDVNADGAAERSTENEDLLFVDIVPFVEVLERRLLVRNTKQNKTKQNTSSMTDTAERKRFDTHKQKGRSFIPTLFNTHTKIKKINKRIKEYRQQRRKQRRRSDAHLAVHSKSLLIRLSVTESVPFCYRRSETKTRREEMSGYVKK